MTISTSLAQQLGINTILFQQTRLSETQQQISLGKRILKPSDDPAGTVRLLDLNQAISRNSQFQENLDVAVNNLSQEEGVLQGVTNALQRVRELAVQGFNDSNTQPDKASIAVEISQQLEQLIALANSQDAEGNYLFAGFKTNIKPFTGDSVAGGFSYLGDDNQRLLQIGENRFITDHNPGSEIFFDLVDKNGNPEDLFTTLFNLAADLTANRPAYEEMVVTTGAQPADAETVTIDGITYEFDSGGGVTAGNVAVTIGADTDATTTNLAAAITAQNVAGNTTVTASASGSELTLVAGIEGAGNLSFTDGTGGDVTVTTPISIPLYDHLDQIDVGLDKILEVRATVGARLNVLENQDEINQDLILSVQTIKSQTEDLDMAEAISRFNLQIVSLQAAQQAFLRVQGLSLFNQL